MAGTLEGVLTSPPTSPDPSARDWTSFDHAGDTYLFDATFLRSNWSCIFGQGCKGILEEDATELGQGCCSHGAHFADSPDRKRTRKAAARLTSAQWQFKDFADEEGGPFQKTKAGESTTRVHQGACIFLNRPDFHLGSGCALHVGAVEAGESFLDWKPEVCWQLPLRLTHQIDEVGHTTWTLREWMRRDWGEGGEEFHWWCTESPEAFVGKDSVVITLKEDIVRLVGPAVYEKLLVALGQVPQEAWVPHPAVRRQSTL